MDRRAGKDGFVNEKLGKLVPRGGKILFTWTFANQHQAQTLDL
jgi:hypothetical protein